MRRVLMTACTLAISLGAFAPIAQAQESQPAKSVCIRAYDIDHTKIQDKNTILFYMRGGKVWKNALTSPCYTLKMSTEGFIYSPTNPGTDEICSNLQTVRVRDTGETCFLGEFTPYDPKAPPAPPVSN